MQSLSKRTTSAWLGERIERYLWASLERFCKGKKKKTKNYNNNNKKTKLLTHGESRRGPDAQCKG